jgi:hypothetical protein
VWTSLGTSDDLAWGSYRGTAAIPYEVAADLADGRTRCTCPSRRVPCKHALDLLRLRAEGKVPAGEPSAALLAWQRERPAQRSRSPRDEAAAEQRAERRAERVAAGLGELETWLQDQVRTGLATARWGHADGIAARMVDAQAPGVAGQLRRLSTVPASGDGWPARLLGGYGRLHLLARAHERLADLSEPLAATVRTYVGYPTARDRVLAEPAVTDTWDVLGRRDLLDAAVPGRRVWLRGRRDARWALVLMFDPNGNFGSHPDAPPPVGTALTAELHYYPGTPSLRVVVGARHETAAGRTDGEAAGTLADARGDWAAALELDPWLPEWPAVVRGVPVPGARGWQLVDDSGAVSVLSGGADPWTLAAVSGGAPIPVFGEWSAEGFRPLTTWHAGRAVAA